MTKAFLTAVLIVSIFRAGWKCYLGSIPSVPHSGDGHASWVISLCCDFIFGGGALWLLVYA